MGLLDTWPEIIAGILVIVLAIATIIALLKARKSKRKKKGIAALFILSAIST